MIRHNARLPRGTRIAGRRTESGQVRSAEANGSSNKRVPGGKDVSRERKSALCWAVLLARPECMNYYISLTDCRSTSIELVGRRDQALASKRALVSAARTCFTEEGYEATTVAAILERARMARGALYHYFPGGKAEIFAAVFDAVDAEYHERRDAMLALPSAVERLKGGIGVFLELCADESFARIALSDAPRVVPGQDKPGTSYKLLREQLADAIATNELPYFDLDAITMSLYGAIRSAGEYVISSDHPLEAVRTATDTIAALIDGLRPDR